MWEKACLIWMVFLCQHLRPLRGQQCTVRPQAACARTGLALHHIFVSGPTPARCPQGIQAEGSSGRWVVLRCASTYCLPWQCLASSCRQPQQHRMASCRWPSCAWCPSFMPWLVSLAVMHVGFCNVQGLIDHSSPDTGKCMAVTGCRGPSWPVRPCVCALPPDAESAAPPCNMRQGWQQHRALLR